MIIRPEILEECVGVHGGTEKISLYRINVFFLYVNGHQKKNPPSVMLVCIEDACAGSGLLTHTEGQPTMKLSAWQRPKLSHNRGLTRSDETRSETYLMARRYVGSDFMDIVRTTPSR